MLLGYTRNIEVADPMYASPDPVLNYCLGSAHSSPELCNELMRDEFMRGQEGVVPLEGDPYTDDALGAGALWDYAMGCAAW